MDNLLAGVEAGKGNLGKLLKDEELYNTINAITVEGKKLLTDIRTGNGTLSKLIYDDKLYQEVRAPLTAHRRHAGRCPGRAGHRRQDAEGSGAVRRSQADHRRDATSCWPT